jgi:ribose-phosphate pyrophosphokinase
MTYFLNESTHHLRRLYLNRGAAVGSYQALQFGDGEFGYRLSEDMRRQSATVVASILPDPSSLFDLLALFRVLHDNRAQRPSLILPYLGYARQDSPGPGEAAIGVMVAELIRNLNAARTFVVDVHSETVFRALGPLAEDVSVLPLFAERLAEANIEVVVAADEGARLRAEAFASLLGPNVAVAVVKKTRTKPGTASARGLIGDVARKRCVIVDDLIDTGSTMTEAIRLVSAKGADRIHAVATHGIFSKDARERLAKTDVAEILVTNTLPQARHPLVKVLDITPMLLSLPERP